MAANTVLNYLPRESVVHKLTGTTKLAFFLRAFQVLCKQKKLI